MVCETYPFQTTNVGNVCFFRLPIPNKMCEEMLVHIGKKRQHRREITPISIVISQPLTHLFWAV